MDFRNIICWIVLISSFCTGIYAGISCSLIWILALTGLMISIMVVSFVILALIDKGSEISALIAGCEILAFSFFELSVWPTYFLTWLINNPPA